LIKVFELFEGIKIIFYLFSGYLIFLKLTWIGESSIFTVHRVISKIWWNSL